jgi:two-component system, NarL family, sensor histidine kinase DevS
MLLTREQLQERLIALHKASLELVKDVSLETLLERIASVACEQSDAQYAAVGVLDDNGRLKQFITVGMTRDEVKRIAHPPVGEGLIGELMNTEVPLRVPVIRDHPKSVGFPEHHPLMVSFLGVPIRAGDRQLGQIYLTKKPGESEFTADDEKIIQMLGAYAAAAIQNARLHENTQRLAVLEERERIGMDLHDGIIQSIYGVGLSLENAIHSMEENPNSAKERVQHAISGLNRAIRDLRSYILDLKPRKMGNDGLISGIRRLVVEYRANTLAQVYLAEPESDMKDMTQAGSTALFHICQEALANAAKHSRAKKVQVSLWATDERVLLEIHDDGNGFDMESVNATIGHGLANMQTRAKSVGGDVDISSVINEGTTVFAWVPRDARQ